MADGTENRSMNTNTPKNPKAMKTRLDCENLARIGPDFEMEITQRRSCILNPDVVAEWSQECTKSDCVSKALRGRALLPEIQRNFRHELPRAQKAVELWEEAGVGNFYTIVIHKDKSPSIFHFWNNDYLTNGRLNHDVLACEVVHGTFRDAINVQRRLMAIVKTCGF